MYPFITQKLYFLRTTILRLGVVVHPCSPSPQEDPEYQARPSCYTVKPYLRIKEERWGALETSSHSSGAIHIFAYLCRRRSMHSPEKMPKISEQLLPLGEGLRSEPWGEGGRAERLSLDLFSLIRRLLGFRLDSISQSWPDTSWKHKVALLFFHFSSLRETSLGSP